MARYKCQNGDCTSGKTDTRLITPFAGHPCRNIKRISGRLPFEIAGEKIKPKTTRLSSSALTYGRVVVVSFETRQTANTVHLTTGGRTFFVSVRSGFRRRYRAVVARRAHLVDTFLGAIVGPGKSITIGVRHFSSGTIYDRPSSRQRSRNFHRYSGSANRARIIYTIRLALLYRPAF